MTPIVFVHGNPDSDRVWDLLRAELSGVETVALQMPGFGCPLPSEGFDCTRWAYRDWLAGELEALGEPAHVVAHDLGSAVLHGVLLERPELVASWALTGICDADFFWHPQARIWQTSRLGEESRDAWLSLSDDQKLDLLRANGVPDATAPGIVEKLDRRMCDALIALYRSITFFGDWTLTAEHDLPPGLVLTGDGDQFQDVSFAERCAQRTGARLHVFEDTAHWWQVERPKDAASTLRAFWADLPTGAAAVSAG
jgi:pimeloyl-ACP methyl ester carboxylesterase